MAAQLNEQEQAKVDRYQELKWAMHWGKIPNNAVQLENARQLADYAESNAEARANMQAQRQADKDAEAARHQARRDAEALAAQEQYKTTARATFPGTAAQFEAAWPELLRAWQIRNTTTDMDALVARKRQQMGDMF